MLGAAQADACGAEQLDVDTKKRRMTAGDTVVEEGDVISIDGTSGAVYLGEVGVMPSPVVEYFEGNLDPDDLDDDDVNTAL
ncbi:MAG: pyruvate, orthophosphate dikinase, partial [Actinomycetota bacterium]|nr:pyruvate, orthophosphate dikinase [Actinomycetota bacterium]